MSRDLALLDTNVLIYALYKDSDHYPAARALLEHAVQDDAGFCITPQVLAEFYAVVTHPKRVTHPKSPEEARNAIAGFLAMPGMLSLDTARYRVPLDGAGSEVPTACDEPQDLRCPARGHDARPWGEEDLHLQRL